MVQVDVFWAYGLGASLAAASGRLVSKEPSVFYNKYFIWTVLFLALIWSPTGLLLLIEHPSWETMQAAENFSSMSAFLVLAFGITNVTQGILGWWVGQRLMSSGRYYAAQLNWLIGYFGMFFILVFGWDGMGYDRFLYDRDMLPGSPAWTTGVGTAQGILPALSQFVVSSVSMTLYLDGLYLLPPFFIMICMMLRQSALSDASISGAQAPSHAKVILSYFGSVYIIGLGSAIFVAMGAWGFGRMFGLDYSSAEPFSGSALTIHVLSYMLCLPVCLAIIWFTLLKPGRLLSRLLAPLCLTDDGTGAETSMDSGTASLS